MVYGDSDSAPNSNSTDLVMEVGAGEDETVVDRFVAALDSITMRLVAVPLCVFVAVVEAAVEVLALVVELLQMSIVHLN